jgi:hypothetical protein
MTKFIQRSVPRATSVINRSFGERSSISANKCEVIALRNSPQEFLIYENISGDFSAEASALTGANLFARDKLRR